MVGLLKTVKRSALAEPRICNRTVLHIACHLHIACQLHVIIVTLQDVSSVDKLYENLGLGIEIKHLPGMRSAVPQT